MSYTISYLQQLGSPKFELSFVELKLNLSTRHQKGLTGRSACVIIKLKLFRYLP